MKHVSIGEAEKQLATLVAEVESGREVVLTRDGAPVAKLVQNAPDATKPFTPEQIAQRRKALEELWEIGRSLDIRLSREEIKARIAEGRR